MEGSFGANYVFVSRTTTRGQKVATTTLTLEKAEALLTKGHLVIGGSAAWYNLRIWSLDVTNALDLVTWWWSTLSQTVAYFDRNAEVGITKLLPVMYHWVPSFIPQVAQNPRMSQALVVARFIKYPLTRLSHKKWSLFFNSIYNITRQPNSFSQN